MPDTKRQPQTQFFTLRMWRAEVADGQVEWRGKLHHVRTRETRYFREWPTLAACLRDMLSDSESSRPPPPADG